jgi:hypothetical protein
MPNIFDDCVTPEDLARGSREDVQNFASVSWVLATNSIEKLRELGVDPVKFRNIFPHGETWLGADFGLARDLGPEVYSETLRLFAASCDAEDCSRELAAREPK